ncbi:hypothetical protein INT43_000312 [Umbelopsis isabellina]|uniref:Zn(2)-C6 fungal-type domain-containing protein n=1 Tax=Mortierella isabellina TaxID=91625 RepID=A0A8H7ULQ8_MORIS|nr:hypothetical protein INT43_000312 [Umbelopsis isabellina]
MPKEKRVQRACDQCNFRRVKCSHDQPCSNCRRYDVDCSYWKASRGIEASGSRIASLRRLRHGQDSNIAESPGPIFGSKSPFLVPSNQSTNSDQLSYNRSPNLVVENIGNNATTSSYVPRDEPQSAPNVPDPNKRQRSVQRIPQHARLELSASPMLDSASNLANLIESAFSELAPDVATQFRMPNLETPVAETVFNATNFSERSQFPDFGTFMDLSQSSLPLGTGPPNSSFMQNSYPTLASSYSHSGNNAASLEDIYSSDDEFSSFDVESSSLSDSVLIPRIAIFFERLHPIIPVFTRAWIFTRLDNSHQYSDRQFAAMLLSMSSLSLIQPVHSSEGSDFKSNTKCAVRLLKECIHVRSVSTFGKKPTLDMVLTSFYMFACFFGLHEDDSAWFRLREAITLGQILKLHDPSAYESLDHDERERRLRTYWILAITERAVALQRGHSIGILGHPSESMKSISQRFNIGELDDFPSSQLRLFDSVDEDFVDCWNGHCAGEKCHKLHANKALSLNSSFDNSEVIGSTKAPNSEQRGSTVSERSAECHGTVDSRTPSRSKRRHTELQRADVEVTRHWLLNRLWYVCLTHGLIAVDTPHSSLQPDYPITIARNMLVICEDLTLISMEANGLGFCEKLYDIVRTLVIVCHMFSEESSEISKARGFGDKARDADNNFRQNQNDISINAQMQVSHLLADEIDARNATLEQNHPKSISQDLPSGSHISSSIASEQRQDDCAQPTPSFSQLLPSQYTTVQDIFNGYLSVFRRFRAGDHQFLAKLIETMRDLSLDINE